MQVTIWLINGTIYRNVTVTGSNLKVRGNPLDINSVSKIDSAYIFTDGGDDKIERDDASGSIQIKVAGVTGNVAIDLVEIADLIPGAG
ncbi:MAG TPA: hypothetical protein VKV04_24995 [Verrucomicrobiae bacterium]|nr:hypothetical protein [Verrucomicrobiae bacterium]